MIQKMNLEREGWKSPSLSLATLAKPGKARVPAAHRLAPAPRTETTAWQLLVWTYQRQKAHLGDHRLAATGFSPISPTGAVIERLRLGVSVDVSRGAGVTGPRCDGDALAVHDLVLLMGKQGWCLIDSGAVGAKPEWSQTVPPLKVGPVRRGNGKPKMFYENNRAIACELAYEGFRPDRAAALIRYARECYAAWWASLAALHAALTEDQPLRRWLITELGAAFEPWHKSQA
jgi:hypothetical protein